MVSVGYFNRRLEPDSRPDSRFNSGRFVSQGAQHNMMAVEDFGMPDFPEQMEVYCAAPSTVPMDTPASLPIS
jgi:hypothetical protein